MAERWGRKYQNRYPKDPPSREVGFSLGFVCCRDLFSLFFLERKVSRECGREVAVGAHEYAKRTSCSERKSNSISIVSTSRNENLRSE